MPRHTFRRQQALAYTAVFTIAFSVTATPSWAFPFGRKPPAANQEPSTGARGRPLSPQIQSPGATTSTAATAEAPRTTPPPPATAAERQAARGMDLVNQSTFWLQELVKNSADTEAALEASTTLRRIGSFERAAEVAAIGLQSKGEEPRLWSALGLAFVAAGRNEDAIQALRKAIILTPRDPILHSSLGVAFDRIERSDLAKPEFEQALSLAPNDTSILTNFGLSLAMGGDLPRAETLLRRAADNPLAPPQSRQNLALVVGLQGRFEESERIASRDLPAEVAAENVAYLRRMLNGNETSRWDQARAGLSN
jgi:Flp pilus assembly protein TadD